jgi:enolase-phosphatase E1
MIEAVVTDIEGTTSSLSFVKDVLFPYAREHVGRYLERHAADVRIAAHLREVRELMGCADAGLGEVVTQLRRWMDEDRKVTPLKALQGWIWEEGYYSGAFSGHVYEDAVSALRRWHDQGLRLYVYSSGSVHAQKLLFAHTAYGDLTPLFSGYYDTRIGAKAEPASYRRIAEAVATSGHRILFLSDAEAELGAATTAGMQVLQLARPGETAACSTYPHVSSFAQIDVRAY